MLLWNIAADDNAKPELAVTKPVEPGTNDIMLKLGPMFGKLSPMPESMQIFKKN